MNSKSANQKARGFNFFHTHTLHLIGALGQTIPHAHCSIFAISHNPIFRTLVCKRASILPSYH
jgi:hypothetical protein